MMKIAAVVSSTAAVLLLVACERSAHSQPRPQTPPRATLVNAGDVVNALKCELARTFGQKSRLGIVEPKIEAELELSVELTRDTNIEGGVGPSFSVVELEVGASQATSRELSDTLALSFRFDLEGVSGIPSFCVQADKRLKVTGQPFGTLLDAINAEYGKISAGAPRVTLLELKHTAGFAVERSTTSSGSINVLVFKLGGDNTTTRSASQSLTMTFSLALAPNLTPPS